MEHSISLFFLSQSQSVLFRDHEQYTCKVVSSIPYTRGNTTCEFTAGCAKQRLHTALVAGASAVLPPQYACANASIFSLNFASFAWRTIATSNQMQKREREKRCYSSPFGTRITCSISKGKKKVHAWCEPDDLSWVLPIVELEAVVLALAERKRYGAARFRSLLGICQPAGSRRQTGPVRPHPARRPSRP